MPAKTLYDFSPLVPMMFAGVALAMGPLTWVWLRNRRSSPLRRLQALTLLTLFLTFDLVLFGAFTRLTDSGLGCPDWPGCYGQASPIGASDDIAQAQVAQPTGPVTRGKAWVEMIHRYLATAVGVLIMVIAGAVWLARLAPGRMPQRSPSIGVWWPTLTLIWVCIQGAFGALTVTMKLFPAVVTMHLLGGLLLLAMLCVQVVRLSQLDADRTPVVVGLGLRRLLVLSTVLLVVQVALGGWVSTNYAVLACTDFPLCQNRWWPVMDFSQGFEVWRELGMTGAGEPLTFASLTAIHYAHRMMAFVVLTVLGLLAWRLNRVPALRRQSRLIAGLVGMQLTTGLSTVVLGWPLLAAVLHTGGAAALVLVLTWTVLASASPARVAK